jgi:hypothetical protein
MIAQPAYSQEQLKEAFDKVCSKEHWKLPIDTTIDHNDMDLVQYSIVHFTGSVPTFTPIMGTKLMRVQACGYYIAVGA